MLYRLVSLNGHCDYFAFVNIKWNYVFYVSGSFSGVDGKPNEPIKADPTSSSEAKTEESGENLDHF